MQVPRVIRFRLLWLGLPGLLFLLWAWVDSTHHGYGMGWGGKGLGLFFFHGDACVGIGLDDASRREQGMDRWEWDPADPAARESDDPPRLSPWLPAPQLLAWHGDANVWRLLLPHWLLTGLYLAAWAAAAWRQRRWQARRFAGEPAGLA